MMTARRPTALQDGGARRRDTEVRKPARVARLWTVEDVSRYLSVPVETLYRWRKAGTGPPAARIGRHLRYDPADVYSWVRTRVG